MCKGEVSALVHLREQARSERGVIALELAELTGEEPTSPLPSCPAGHAPYCTLTPCSCEPLTDKYETTLELMGASASLELEEWSSYHYEGALEPIAEDPDPVLSAQLMPH